ncbi:MAG: hypothetical protein ABFD04_05415 [Syntrophomonas sp.]
MDVIRGGKPDQSNESLPKAEQNDQKAVTALINDFGTKFAMVSSAVHMK